MIWFNGGVTSTRRRLIGCLHHLTLLHHPSFLTLVVRGQTCEANCRLLIQIKSHCLCLVNWHSAKTKQRLERLTGLILLASAFVLNTPELAAANVYSISPDFEAFHEGFLWNELSSVLHCCVYFVTGLFPTNARTTISSKFRNFRHQKLTFVPKFYARKGQL